MHAGNLQVRISLSLPQGLLDAIDKARGSTSRSEFLRLSAAEKIGLGKEFVSAPDRVGKGGRPTHKGAAVYDLKEVEQKVAEGLPVYTLPFRGEVAAGEPMATEIEEVVKVPRPYPKGCFVVRVSGRSMEPELQDGDLIVVDGREAYTPGNGRICVVSDGTGSSVKKWNRQAGLFESLNPDYPDLEPTEDLVFQGYYVEKV